MLNDHMTCVQSISRLAVRLLVLAVMSALIQGCANHRDVTILTFFTRNAGPLMLGDVRVDLGRGQVLSHLDVVYPGGVSTEIGGYRLPEVMTVSWTDRGGKTFTAKVPLAAAFASKEKIRGFVFVFYADRVRVLVTTRVEDVRTGTLEIYPGLTIEPMRDSR